MNHEHRAQSGGLFTGVGRHTLCQRGCSQWRHCVTESVSWRRSATCVQRGVGTIHVYVHFYVHVHVYVHIHVHRWRRHVPLCVDWPARRPSTRRGTASRRPPRQGAASSPAPRSGPAATVASPPGGDSRRFRSAPSPYRKSRRFHRKCPATSLPVSVEGATSLVNRKCFRVFSQCFVSCSGRGV